MPTLYFMRHAKTEMNQKGVWSGITDCDITEEGKHATIEVFKNFNTTFDLFYVSPLRRTKQTMDVIFPNQNAIIDKRLIERDFGDWEGQPYSIIDNETTELYINGKVQPPNGETYQKVKERVTSFVEDMYFQHHGNKKILIVAHATILRMVRDVFFPDMEKRLIKNSQIIVVTDNDFKKWKERTAL